MSKHTRQVEGESHVQKPSASTALSSFDMHKAYRKKLVLRASVALCRSWSKSVSLKVSEILENARQVA